MSSVIGHALAGLVPASSLLRTLSPAEKAKMAAAAFFCSVAPDLDVPLFWFFAPAGLASHRGFSHTLLFVLIVALATSFLVRKVAKQQTLVLIFFLSGVSHLLLDCLMGAGAGVPFFWPVSERRFLSPVIVLPIAYYPTSSRGLLDVLLFPGTYLGFILEFMIFAPILAIGYGWRRNVYYVMPVVALVITLLIYNVRA